MSDAVFGAFEAGWRSASDSLGNDLQTDRLASWKEEIRASDAQDKRAVWSWLRPPMAPPPCSVVDAEHVSHSTPAAMDDLVRNFWQNL